MSAAAAAREAGRRVEEILDELAASGDRRAPAAAEELVRVLMEFYGAGLARIVEALGPVRPGSTAPITPLLGDELVASLLVLHDLHPEDVRTRIGRALEQAGAQAEMLGFDETTGVLRLRTAAAAKSGCGCGSGAADTTRAALEDALACFAPEVTGVDIEPAAAPPAPLLQIGTRPPTPARVP
ncbi:hypothetical protein AB0F18_33180 [Streptomyces sp. NPDC029216]|uniref:hypothetical protein n=1 Tax=Streptomyces sp. NPDC029216 TaxID=3154701 RepID=UPI003404E915